MNKQMREAVDVVFGALDSKEPVSKQQIIEKTDLDEKLVDQALAWLSEEGKLYPGTPGTGQEIFMRKS